MKMETTAKRNGTYEISHRNYNWNQYKNNSINRATHQNAITENAIIDYKAGRITVNELYKLGSFERTDCNVGFYNIMNCKNGVAECGRLVKINGCLDFIMQIPYIGNSVERVYRMCYLTDNNEWISVKWVWNEIQWTNDIIRQVINREYIDIIRKDGSKYLNSRLTNIMRSLSNRYPNLDLTNL
jgi:hypothetical protein